MALPVVLGITLDVIKNDLIVKAGNMLVSMIDGNKQAEADASEADTTEADTALFKKNKQKAEADSKRLVGTLQEQSQRLKQKSEEDSRR